MKYTLNFIPPGWKIRNFENKISSRKNSIFTHEYESIPNIFRKINLYSPWRIRGRILNQKKKRRKERGKCTVLVAFGFQKILSPRVQVRHINENRVCVNARNTAQISYRAHSPPLLYTIYQPPFSRCHVSKSGECSLLPATHARLRS